MNILVTGGAGYIGSHTCKLLAERGHKPVVLDNLSTGHRSFVKWGPLVEGDIRQADVVERVIREYSIDAVIHFAASSIVGESVRDPLKYFDNNVVASTEFLKALLKTDVRKIVFSSTCAVYGTPERVPIGEGESRKPINPYGQSKLAVENVLEALSQSHQVGAVALRYFNASGASGEAEIGEDHNPETHLIPLAIRASLEQNYELRVFGDDYDTQDGTCVRDYVHVTDLAEAHLLALDALSTSLGAFHAYNVGTGSGFSVAQVIDEVERVTGKPVKRSMGPRRPGDPATLVADPQKIQRELGWQPKYSSLNNIIETAVRWQKSKAHKL